jgi:aminopeptidase N
MLKPTQLSQLSVVLLASACAVPDEQEAVATAEAHHAPATPGAAGIGDVLYATLGNGGYDVEHYDLDLRYATANPDQAIDGTVRIEARATQALSRFNLDFAGDSFGDVSVDGCEATVSWADGELVITPAHPIRRGERFVVEVEDFVATPEVASADDFLGAPFFITPDGSAWAAQPAGAHQIFPSNDHPRDKASFSFRIDVPANTTAVANGELVGKHTHHGRTVWKYEMNDPMPTELTQVVVGAFTVIPRGKHDGVRVRDVVPTRLVADLSPKLAIETGHITWLEDRLGNYPFESYGTLAVDTSLGFALETQTLSLFEVNFFSEPASGYAPIMVHELAHQWFGNSVAPANWSDVWQSEGHATWYEITYQVAPDSPEFLGFAQQIYELGDIFRALFGPVAAPLSGDPLDVFNPNVYYGGALTLFALRQQIGDVKFQQLERAWVKKYKGRSASTQDFIALASHVSGQSLDAFLNAWLYGTTTPPMPGHPEWTVLPPNASPFTSARAAASTLPPIHMHAMKR